MREMEFDHRDRIMNEIINFLSLLLVQLDSQCVSLSRLDRKCTTRWRNEI